jgi:hypothetical protein
MVVNSKTYTAIDGRIIVLVGSRHVAMLELFIDQDNKLEITSTAIYS